MFKLKLITIFFSPAMFNGKTSRKINIDAAHTYMLTKYASLLSHVISASH